MEVSIRKKMTGNCIIARSAWCKVSVIFFLMDTPSTYKTNEFIPYHLIISKTKYCRIKRYIFHDLFMHYILCDVWVFYDVWVLRHRSMDSKIHQIFQPIEKLVTWEIKWYIKIILRKFKILSKLRGYNNYSHQIAFEMEKSQVKIFVYKRNPWGVCKNAEQNKRRNKKLNECT